MPQEPPDLWWIIHEYDKFSFKWSVGDEHRVSECDQLWITDDM